MINASGKSKIPAFITVLSAIIAFISNFYLVNHYGMEGGAVATLITGFICFISGVYFVHKIFKVSIELNSTLKICGGSLILFSISILLKMKGVFLLGWISVLFAFYLAFLFLIKVINNEDIKLVRELYSSFGSRGLNQES